MIDREMMNHNDQANKSGLVIFISIYERIATCTTVCYSAGCPWLLPCKGGRQGRLVTGQF